MQKQPIFSAPDRLTQSEIDSLRRDKQQTAAYLRELRAKRKQASEAGKVPPAKPGAARRPE